MATSSFDKIFVVKGEGSARVLRAALANPIEVQVQQRDYKKEAEEGLALLKQKLSRLQS